MIRYKRLGVQANTLSLEDFIGVLNRSTLAERRPVHDHACIQAMLINADIIIGAYDDECLVGVARSVTDFSYCCYLSDLAVDQTYQNQGIGKQLIQATRELLGTNCQLILLSAPDARDYYPNIGMKKHDSAWCLLPDEPLA